MPVVDVTIGKRKFKLACGEGQESHLQNLVKGLNGRMEELSDIADSSNDTLLLVMTALMLQDEINEMKAKMKKGNVRSAVDIEREVEEAVSDAMLAISEYVEEVADRIEAV